MRGTGKLTFSHPDYSIQLYISRLRLSDLFSQVCILVLNCFYSVRFEHSVVELCAVLKFFCKRSFDFIMALCYAGSVIWQNFVSYYPLICGTVLSAFCFFYLLFDFTEFFLIRYILVRSLCAFGTCGYCRMDNDNRSFDRLRCTAVRVSV